MREITTQTIVARLRKNELTDEQKTKVENVRSAAIAFGKTLAQNCPQGRSLACSVTRLEEAVSWAKSAIFRN